MPLALSIVALCFGLVGGTIHFALWWRFGKYLWSMLLAGFNLGFLFSALVFFITPLGKYLFVRFFLGFCLFCGLEEAVLWLIEWFSALDSSSAVSDQQRDDSRTRPNSMALFTAEFCVYDALDTELYGNESHEPTKHCSYSVQRPVVSSCFHSPFRAPCDVSLFWPLLQFILPCLSGLEELHAGGFGHCPWSWP